MAGLNITSARVALGIAILLCSISSPSLIVGSDDPDDSTWTLVAPSNTSLSVIKPPSSFIHKANIIFPAGASGLLGKARPALLQTNKFYSNFLMDGPSWAAWTLPYVVTVNKDNPFGIYVSYPAFFSGMREVDGRLKWYGNALNKDLIMTAKELDGNHKTNLVDFSKEGLSVTVMFYAEDGYGGHMKTYLVRGMAYATVYYEIFTPVISSIHAILSINGKGVNEGIHTSFNGIFLLELNDGNRWILYSSDPDIELFYESVQPNEPNRLHANSTMTGVLRAAIVPVDMESIMFREAVELLKAHAGTYPIRGEVSAWINANNKSMGRYDITWITKGGYPEHLLHYALPHHQDLLVSGMMTGVFLGSPTNGVMQLVKGNNWIFVEGDLPEFDWVPSAFQITSDLEMDWINHHLDKEVSQELDNVAGPSVYFGAKNLMAYAQLCLIAKEIGRDDLVEFCVGQVEAGLDYYITSKNGNPLVYDMIWGGLIGSLGLEEGSEGADFYSTYYNDHHFHYSYLVNAAAVVAYLRPSWATVENKNWVETLIRDVNNPSKDDPFFPQFRSFDWFCGHSWARGLLFSLDGKDQESTSEDVNFSYAITMWAIATSNSRLEGLGRLQTGVVSRSIKSYFLLKDTNVNHPFDFVPNKVTGIMFENKVDYTTWFGANVEYIHGIQNIPVTAITEYVREPEFVREEWYQRLEQIIESANGVWATVLYMSYAVIQKHLAFVEMLTSAVDDGLHRTWALYWAATRPECALYCNHNETYIPVVPTPTPPPTEPNGAFITPPAAIPGNIEAEEFDFGGQEIAYVDTDPGNNGGEFRLYEDVDIKLTPDGGYYVGWTRKDEFLRYTVNVKMNVDSFDFDFVVAAPPGRSGSFRIVTGGSGCSNFTVDLSGLVKVESTGGWDVFQTTSVSKGGSGGMWAGPAMLWLCIESSGFNIDSFNMTNASA